MTTSTPNKHFQHLILIADTNDKYRDYLERKWGRTLRKASNTELRQAAEVRDTTSTNLLGIKYTYIVKCNTKEETTAAIDTLHNIEGEPWAGLVISIKAPLNSLRKPLKEAERFGARIVKPAGGKSRAKRELEDAGLSKQHVAIVAEYAGDDITTIIGLLDYLSTLSQEEISSLTLQEVYEHLPETPGTRAPWDIMDAIVARDVPKTISIVNRAGGGAAFPLAVLKTKMEDMLHVSAYVQGGGTSSMDDLSTFMNGNLWLLQNTAQLARTAGFERTLAMSELLSQYLRRPTKSYTLEDFQRLCISLCRT